MDIIECLRQQLTKMTEYADKRNSQALDLEQQLAGALAACEVKDAAIKQACAECGKNFTDSDTRARHKLAIEALAIKPDASVLKAHDEALIERCAKACEDEYVDALGSGCDEDFAYNNALDHAAAAIRELKGQP